MTSTGANTAAIAAALAGNGQPPPHLNRHSLTSKGSGSGRGSEPASGKDDSTRPQSSYASTLNRDDAMEDDDIMQDEDAAVDGMPRGRADSGTSKARTRRASEGAYLSKGEGKRGSGELRCEKCGKGYKHSSCLTKHLSVPCVSFSSLNTSCPVIARLEISLIVDVWRVTVQAVMVDVH